MQFSRRNFANLIFLSPFVTGCSNDPARQIIGKASPKLTAQAIDGSFVYFGELPHPTIVHFFGLWCGPCLAEMPVWNEVIKELKPIGGIDIIQMHLGAVPAQYENIHKWNDSLDADIKAPIILDESREIGNMFQAYGTPSTILIDKNQIIIDHYWSLESHQVRQRLMDTVKKQIINP